MRLFEIYSNSISDELKLFLEEEEDFNFEVEKTVLEMMNNIKKNKFEAVKEYSKNFDNFELDGNNFKVKKDEIELLAQRIDPKLKESFSLAIE
ncbi:MAG TPA: histidinol dehydrogenase, partial [Spirochaetota bacterium]|nr:histidinol dehydrogenase [Spirochaetota bacterium]